MSDIFLWIAISLALVLSATLIGLMWACEIKDHKQK